MAYPTKGHDQQDRPLKASLIDVNMGGRLLKNGIKLWHLDTDYLKTWIYGRIRWPDSEVGGWFLNSAADEDYCRQIVAEELIIKPSGKRVWIARNRENHYLDCEGLALAAAVSLQVHALPDTEGVAKTHDVPAAIPRPMQKPSAFSRQAGGGGSFARRR